MNEKYEVTIEKEDETSGVLVVNYTSINTSIMCGLNLTFYEAIKKYNVDPSNISAILVTKEGISRKISINYTK